MTRITAALIFSPVIISVFFGPYLIVAMPIMLAITLIIAWPLFLIFRRLNWLNWWHACLAGALCAGAFTIFYWSTSPPYHIEYIGVKNAIFYVGTGVLVSLVFWLTGVFRNESFPSISKRFPRSIYILAPIFAIGLWIHNRLDPNLIDGRVISILEQPQVNPERSGSVQLRLSNGSLVVARLPAGLIDSSEPSPVGQCFSLSERLSITLSQKLYFLHTPKFGVGSNDC